VQLNRVALAIALAFACAGASAAPPPLQLPLRFEPSGAGFVARMPGWALTLAGGTATLVFAEPSRAVQIRVACADAGAALAGESPSSAPSHAFLGADPARWRRSIPAFERVRARGVRPGVDLVYYGAEGTLEFDLVAEPGADLASLELLVEGADSVATAPDGALALRIAGQTIELRAPVAYQERGGARTSVLARFERRAADRFGFAIGAHDAARPLVIDPVLSVASYLGGSTRDAGRAIAIDATGAIYLTGETISPDFPVTPGAVQPAFAGGEQDIYVAKVDPSGSKLLWATYLGGSLHDRGFSIAVDAYGSPVITGRTGSTDFPVVAALQPTIGGGDDDAFVVKLAPDGASLEFSTYLGGSDLDRGLAIGVDADGQIVVAGLTLSLDFPTRAPIQASYAGGVSDAFVAKLSAGGALLRFSTYLGGSGSDNVRGLAIDAQNRVLLCGDTDSTDFPVAQALQPANAGGSDAWVGRLDPDGTVLAPATYYGGSGNDFALGCDTSPTGEAVLGGITTSTDFPLRNPVQAVEAGDLDAYVAKLDAGLATRVYSTYLGGSSTDFGLDVALDAQGGATLVGSSSSTNYPTAHPIQAANAGIFDTIITRLGPNGSLDWSTYLGGSQSEIAFDRMGVAVDPFGRPVLTGITLSYDHPVAAPLQAAWAGGYDAFFARIGVGPEVRVSLAPDAAGTRVRLSLANGAQTAQPVELKLWIALDTATTVGLAAEPLVVTIPPENFTTLVDAVLPPALVFPGATFGARLLDPSTGAVRSESVCRSVPCN
jgi:hypothetical protein